jgi:hypothetical protein
MCSHVDTKVLEKHTASICTLILKMETAGTSETLAVKMSQCSKYHLRLLPAMSLFSLQTVHSYAWQPTIFTVHCVTCSFFSSVLKVLMTDQTTIYASLYYTTLQLILHMNISFQTLLVRSCFITHISTYISLKLYMLICSSDTVKKRRERKRDIILQ